MNANDQEQICKAGFVIIRSDDTVLNRRLSLKMNFILEVGKNSERILNQKKKEMNV